MADETEGEVKEESEVYAPKEAPQPTSNLNKLLVPLFFILLIVVGGGAFFFGSRKAQPAPSPTPTPTSEETATPAASPEGTLTPSPTLTKTPSPTPTPTPASQTTTLSSVASMDGFQSSNGGGNKTLEVRAGRNINLVTRGFVSFDLASELTGKTIEKATLRLYQTKVIGNPYSVGSSLKVDHLDYGSSFENADYSAASLSSSFGTLTSNTNIEWKDLEVTDQVKADLSAGRARSQYRFHFAIETIGGDVTGDFAYFESADNSSGTGKTPQLVVKYH